MTTIAIEISNLICKYDENTVIRNTSFSVKTGEFFIIIGPNGSGKSTLLKAMAGLIHSSQGQVKIKHHFLELYTQKTLARTIALVPQVSTFDFPFTVSQVVLMGRTPHQGLLGFEKAEDIQAMEEALVFTDLIQLANRKVYQLSGGERQRVLIARAICQQPEIMLLDEPTAALDLKHQIRIMDLMERLKSEKQLTVVMVSHDINLASMYADNLLLLKNGEVISTGSPAQVLSYDILEKAYGCTLLVDENPIKKCPRLTLVPESYLASFKNRKNDI